MGCGVGDLPNANKLKKKKKKKSLVAFDPEGAQRVKNVK